MVRAMEAVLGAYARALAHISRGYALQEACQVLAVSHGPASPDGADPWAGRGSGAPDQAETVVARAPEWGANVPVPVSWRLDREQVRAWRMHACAVALQADGRHVADARVCVFSTVIINTPASLCSPAGRERDGCLGVRELPAGLRPGAADRGRHAEGDSSEGALFQEHSAYNWHRGQVEA